MTAAAAFRQTSLKYLKIQEKGEGIENGNGKYYARRARKKTRFL